MESRLKNVLHPFVQAEGNDALLVQDQMDICCGVVLQSKAPKQCIDLWGDCLVMDWTHGTNNLGYHLGKIAQREDITRLIYQWFAGAITIVWAEVVGSSCLTLSCIIVHTKQLTRVCTKIFLNIASKCVPQFWYILTVTGRNAVVCGRNMRVTTNLQQVTRQQIGSSRIGTNLSIRWVVNLALTERCLEFSGTKLQFFNSSRTRFPSTPLCTGCQRLYRISDGGIWQVEWLHYGEK